MSMCVHSLQVALVPGYADHTAVDYCTRCTPHTQSPPNDVEACSPEPNRFLQGAMPGVEEEEEEHQACEYLADLEPPVDRPEQTESIDRRPQGASREQFAGEPAFGDKSDDERRDVAPTLNLY